MSLKAEHIQIQSGDGNKDLISMDRQETKMHTKTTFRDIILLEDQSGKDPNTLINSPVGTIMKWRSEYFIRVVDQWKRIMLDDTQPLFHA